jgi:hypothetical protein
MKNIWQNKKAMNPVVASIILLAAAIAVSLATVGWLQKLTMGYTGTTVITVDHAQFTGITGQPTNTMILSLKNTGTNKVTIEMIKVNGKSLSFSAASGQNVTYAPTESKDLTVNNVGWQAGSAYDIEILGDGAQTVGASRAIAVGS